MPISLSPSSMGTFTSCPLAFRFGYIERLPEPPSAPASKGTLVHLALQHLMWRPPAERTIEAALADLARAEAEVAADPEFAQLELTDEERAIVPLRRRDARPPLLRDGRPTRHHRARRRAAGHRGDRGGVTIRGIIDRLELDADGELVVTDYKTGSAPSEGWEQKSMAGVHIYSLLCERMFGRRPSAMQLLYLSKPERIITAPSDQSLRGVEVKTNAVMQAVRQACKRDDFRPRSSALCNYCSFQEFCPEFDGQPELAAADDARPAGRARRPPAAAARLV